MFLNQFMLCWKGPIIFYGLNQCVVLLKDEDYGDVLLKKSRNQSIQENEKDGDIVERLEVWDSKNHQIISWFS